MIAPAGTPHECPVCGGRPVRHLMTLEDRPYWACPRCEARFLDPAHHPNADDERAQYLLHRNDIDDPGYRRFLARLADPLRARLSAGACGLDYGAGPGPALAAMLREAGHPMMLYDPFFAPDASVLARSYDFVTCTETAEHFHAPAREFARMMSLVRPGGWLAIMTCFQTDDARFAGWQYRADPTHVTFYREATFRHLAARHGWACEIPAKDIALLHRARTAAIG